MSVPALSYWDEKVWSQMEGQTRLDGVEYIIRGTRSNTYIYRRTDTYLTYLIGIAEGVSTRDVMKYFPSYLVRVSLQ